MNDNTTDEIVTEPTKAAIFIERTKSNLFDTTNNEQRFKDYWPPKETGDFFLPFFTAKDEFHPVIKSAEAFLENVQRPKQ